MSPLENKGELPRKGLEPPRIAAPEPKSGVSTNFTTWANKNDVRLLIFGVLSQLGSNKIFVSLFQNILGSGNNKFKG